MGGGNGRWLWVWRSESRDTVPPFQSPFLFQMSLQVRQLLERARSTENREVGGMETVRKDGLVGSDVTLSTLWDVEC